MVTKSVHSENSYLILVGGLCDETRLLYTMVLKSRVQLKHLIFLSQRKMKVFVNNLNHLPEVVLRKWSNLLLHFYFAESSSLRDWFILQ